MTALPPPPPPSGAHLLDVPPDTVLMVPVRVVLHLPADPATQTLAVLHVETIGTQPSMVLLDATDLVGAVVVPRG